MEKPQPMSEFDSRIRQLRALSASAAAEARDDDAAMVFAELFVTMAMNPPSGKKRTRDEAMELFARYFVGQNLV